ncbi:Crp/Fnr family transcriptional regulator [Lachnospiraceae bacterium LCP25S3_G4]
MEQKYLYQVLPFLREIDKKRREKIENYFMSAPVWLMDSFQIVQMDKGVTFVRENTQVDMIYIIGSGMIRGVDYRIYGIAYDFMRFNGIYAMGGMEVIMDLEYYRTTLQTVTPCTMIKIPKIQYEKWLKTDIKALKQEAKFMGEYLLEQGRNSRAFLFLQGSDRLAMLFMGKFEQYAKNGLLTIMSTRVELSEETGLCVKTINRSVKKFEEEKLITRDGNKIMIDAKQYKQLQAIVSAIVEH